MNRIPAEVHLAFIVTATVETGPDSYTIHLTARRAPNVSPRVEKATVIQRTEFTESLE